MSCTVVCVKNDVVVHVEPQPTVTITKEEFLRHVASSIKPILPKALHNTLFIRYRDNVESFPIAPSGKRDIQSLTNEGATCAAPYNVILG